MSTYGGYAGKVIQIDLTNETFSEYPWSEREQALYLGGKAMAARILCDHLTGHETAFSEENRIVISTGPLTGSGAPGSSRFDIAAISPKDDLPAFSNCGGNFGIYLKRAGYDALILTGRCKEKRWIEICEDRVLFHDAIKLWGTGTGECQETLEKMHRTNQFGRLCIGPAGENLVKFASVMSDDHAAGRAGIGAVFGWKNLKALTVSGSKKTTLSAPDAVVDCNREWYTNLRGSAADKAAEDAPVCLGCPLRCAKHLHTEQEAILNELGMDAIAAEDAAIWAAEQGMPIQGLYEDMAYRRGIGDKLAEGVPHRKGKGGTRRSGSFGAIMEAFSLPPDDPKAEIFCRDLTEAISVAGQCMFTVNVLRPGDIPNLFVLQMLRCVTGMELTLEDLLRIGRNSRKLEAQLRQSFDK